MLMTYSPTKPMKKSSMAWRKNMPTTKGARPAENESQKISFITK